MSQFPMKSYTYVLENLMLAPSEKRYYGYTRPKHWWNPFGSTKIIWVELAKAKTFDSVVETIQFSRLYTNMSEYECEIRMVWDGGGVE